MPSLVGDLWIVPLGNGMVAPLARRTCSADAVAMTGAPVPLKEIAPIQVCGDGLATLMGSGLKVRPVSGAAVLNSGTSNLRKLVRGVASSPGGGLIAARLLRYSGTRTSTLRRKLVRVAAAAASPACVA